MITRRNFLGTTAIIGAAGTAILGGQESQPVANSATGGAPESTVANSAASGAPESTVGTYLATRLEQAGVRDYFVVPGDFNLILLDQILANPRLRMIGCCNELNAGYAADGYARSNGVAAMVVTYSVGGLSALNAVTCAYSEDLPVIVVVGGINSDSEWQDKIIHHALGEVRYYYQREIYAHVTAGAFSVRHAADAPAVIDGAIDLALRRRKPVMLEIACNLAEQSLAAGARGRVEAPPAGVARGVPQAGRRRGLRRRLRPGRQGDVPRDPPRLRRDLLGPRQLAGRRLGCRVGRRLSLRPSPAVGLRHDRITVG